MSTPYQTKSFGITSKGKEATLYTLQSNKIQLSVTDFGTTLVNLFVPDKDGNPVDIVLGYGDVLGYEKDSSNFGFNIGRNANRIGNAKFTLNGTEYALDVNDGQNNLHSGNHPYAKRFWTVENVCDSSITFSLESPHMDQGFPGAMTVYVTYSLVGDDSFEIHYEATPDRDTLLNMTNHSYFNLDGQGTGDILAHRLQIYADAYTPTDGNLIPTGEILSVTNTPMDFREPKTVGQDISCDFEAIKLGNGYDHNWITGNNGDMHKIISVSSHKTGIAMEIKTDYPGVQVYTGNFLKDTIGKESSMEKAGAHYYFRNAICFEPQYFPDAIHHENFPSPICKAGQKYSKKIVYRFAIS